MNNRTTPKATDTGHARPNLPEGPELEALQVIERPDGYYWRSPGLAREPGPFATRAEAEQDMELFDEEALEVGESVEEAEAEIGIADWVDPDTGELAEETLSRIEEH